MTSNSNVTSDSETATGIVDGSLVRPPQQRRRSEVGFEWSYHLLILLIAASILVMSFLMRAEGDRWVFLPGAVFPLPDGCLSRRLLGWDCPGCGLTRSFIQMSHGDWGKALQFNYAGPIVYLFTVFQLPWQSFQLIRIVRGQAPLFSPWLFLLPGVVLGSLVIQWAFRFI